MDRGATNRSSMTKVGGSVDGGTRTHTHAMPGDKSHDMHIGGDGATHLAKAKGHLEEMRRERPDNHGVKR